MNRAGTDLAALMAFGIRSFATSLGERVGFRQRNTESASTINEEIYEQIRQREREHETARAAARDRRVRMVTVLLFGVGIVFVILMGAGMMPGG